MFGRPAGGSRSAAPLGIPELEGQARRREKRGIRRDARLLYDRVGEGEGVPVLGLRQGVEAGEPQPRSELGVFALGEGELVPRFEPLVAPVGHAGELHPRGQRRRPVDRAQIRAVVRRGPGHAVEPRVR